MNKLQQLINKQKEEFNKYFGAEYDNNGHATKLLAIAGETELLLKNFIQKQRQEIIDMIREDVERIKLEVDVVACDCGRPYKESDLADLVNELLEKLQ